jgi:hypothetical protein
MRLDASWSAQLRLILQLRDGIHGGARLLPRPVSFRTSDVQDATVFSAKTVVFPAIIPLLCRKHLPADFEKPLLHVCAHFSPYCPCYQQHTSVP